MAKNQNKINPKLIPRLNYGYSLKDALIAATALFRKSPIHKDLKLLFENENIFFLNQARTGLRILLNSIGLHKGAKIGVQIYNCHTVFNAIRAAGMCPVFLDINNDFTIDIDDLKKKTKKLDGLIITHTFGDPADIYNIKACLGNKPIIEDCAHSFLSRYDNKLTGTHGDAAIFSFNQGKFPSIATGGFVIVKDKFLSSFKKQFILLKQNSIFDEVVNILKNIVLAQIHKPPIYGIFTVPILKTSKNQDYEKEVPKESKCYKSNEFLFYCKTKLFNKYLKIQQKNASLLLKHLGKSFNEGNNYFMIPFVTSEQKRMIKFCHKKGMEIGSHFAKSIEWAKPHGYKTGDCPNMEALLNNFVTIPCYYSYPLAKIYKYWDLSV